MAKKKKSVKKRWNFVFTENLDSENEFEIGGIDEFTPEIECSFKVFQDDPALAIVKVISSTKTKAKKAAKKFLEQYLKKYPDGWGKPQKMYDFLYKELSEKCKSCGADINNRNAAICISGEWKCERCMND